MFLSSMIFRAFHIVLLFPGAILVSTTYFLILEDMFKKLLFVTNSSHKGALIFTTSRRCYCQEYKIIRNLDTAHLKRGTGGKSSFNGNVVTVFGATGFLGSYVCSHLITKGAQVIIPHRRDPDDPAVKSLKVGADLGQVLFMPFNLRDPMSIKKAIKYSNVVVNLIGRDFETSNFSYYDVHVKSAQAIAAACREMNIERLIHFSSLNVTDKPKRFYFKKLNYLKGKLEGEQALLEEYPTATIFRPSNIYGFRDRFLWPLCTRLRSFWDSTPLYANGMKTLKQPIFAPDVSKAVYCAIEDYSTRGKIFQAVGPERFYLKDISRFCSQVLQRHHNSDSLTHDIKYDLFFFLKVFICREIIEFASHTPIHNLSFEFIERESVTDVVDRCLPTVAELGVSLSKFEDVVPHLIYRIFKKYPAVERNCNSYLPPESLSKKAIDDFIVF